MKGKIVVKALLAVSICCSIGFATSKIEANAGELIEAEETETEEIEAEEIAVGESLDEEPLIGSVETIDSGVISWDGTTKTLKIIKDEYFVSNTETLYKNNAEHIEIGGSVTAIKSEAFKLFSNLKTVKFTSSQLKEIGYRAFYNCKNLESIEFHEGLHYIGNEAFYTCKQLKYIKIPDSVVMIDDKAFFDCNNLESVSFGSGIKLIGKQAFDTETSSKLKTVNFAKINGLVIDSFAFSNTAIEEINLPEGLVSLKEYAFSGEVSKTGKLKKITLPESLKEIGKGVVAITNVEEITIPTGVSIIDDGVLQLSSSVKKVENKSNVPCKLQEFGGKSWYKSDDYEKKNPITEITNGTALRSDYTPWPTAPVKPTPTGAPKPTPTGTPKPTPTGKPVDPTSLDPTKRFSDVLPGKWYSKTEGPIAYVVANGIMSGTGDGSTFSPEDNCTREMFVQTIYNIEGKPGAGSANPFKDVKKTWYYDAVTWAFQNGITSGTSADTFGIGGLVTREQLAQFLLNYAKKRGFDISARTDISGYPDAGTVSGWAKDAMSWANANEIIGGKAKDGAKYLAPGDNATRAEVAQMIMKFQMKFGK